MSRQYVSGTTTVGTTPAVICSPGQNSDGVLIQNNGAASLLIGGSSVAASGANVGISVAAGGTLLVPSVGGSNDSGGSGGLYGIVSSGSAVVAWLYPSTT